MGTAWSSERCIMRAINPDKVAPWFDPWKLKAYFMLDGYDNYGAPLSRIVGVSEKVARDKVSESRFTHEETIMIAKAMGLTKDQYCDIFVKNLYGEKKEVPDE